MKQPPLDTGSPTHAYELPPRRHVGKLVSSSTAPHFAVTDTGEPRAYELPPRRHVGKPVSSGECFIG